MGVCNLFNKLTSPSGNFMLFSQYVEDITRNYSDGDNWKVVPTKFVALNIDFDEVRYHDRVAPPANNMTDRNITIPTYFQNCFENACAYGREHYSEWAELTNASVKYWTPEISRNLFWNCMFDGGFVHPVEYGAVKKVKEIVYFDDISMNAYNEHKGMGYGELYCYIPTDGQRMNAQVIEIESIDASGRKFEEPAEKQFLEGHTDVAIANYKQEYFYNRDFTMSFDDPSVSNLAESAESSFNINTIVVLYDVFKKLNDEWISEYSCIPMGMYFTGRFIDNKMTNTATKYVTTSYGTGTSYGLRICTRFSASPYMTCGGECKKYATVLKEVDLVVDDSNYTNVCQLMTAMNENLSRMMDVVKASNDTTNQYKDLLAVFKNNKTNVPYIKDVNGTDFWFVNGKAVSSVDGGTDTCCNRLNPKTVQKRLDNLMDTDDTNDWSYIEDPNGCDCMVESNHDLVKYINNMVGKDILDIKDFPEYGGGSTGGSGSVVCDCDFELAGAEDVADALNRFTIDDVEYIELTKLRNDLQNLKDRVDEYHPETPDDSEQPE